MTFDLAQSVVSYRLSNGFFPSAAHLLQVTGISREIFKGLSSRVCVRSETFRILSEGTLPSSGARRRIQAIVRVGDYNVDVLSIREDL